MPVLKHSAVAPMLHDPKIVLDLGYLQRQADRMIEAAEQEAGRIVLDAALGAGHGREACVCGERAHDAVDVGLDLV